MATPTSSKGGEAPTSEAAPASARAVATVAKLSEHKKRPKKITVPWVRDHHQRTEPLVMVTAYDFSQARIAEQAGVDMVLVGDSLAMVVLGHDNTLSLSVDEMLHHAKAVRRGVERPLLVVDMPYGSFHKGPADAVGNALRMIKEAGAEAVKIEGARPDVVEALVAAEVPVMAHLGLTPQSLHHFGGFKVQGKSAEARQALLEASVAMQQAGAFSLVLECIPADLAIEVTGELEIPTIGIGAGLGCGGQVLVYHDLLGLEDRLAPRFVRRYANLGAQASQAMARFASDVRGRRFPSTAESYGRPVEGFGTVPAQAPGGSTADADQLERIYG